MWISQLAIFDDQRLKKVHEITARQKNGGENANDKNPRYGLSDDGLVEKSELVELLQRLLGSPPIFPGFDWGKPWVMLSPLGISW